MSPFFQAPDRQAALEAAAAAWVGTPFMPNGAVRGAGVSCQKLVGEIYKACGFLPVDFKIDDGPMDWGHAHTAEESLIAQFVAKQKDRMQEVGAPAVAGDLVGFRIGGCIQHLGVALKDRRFVHCLRPEGVMIRRLDDATYMRRIEKIWRPVQ